MEGDAVRRTPKILVVDDEPKNAKLLEAHLRLEGYEVCLSTDGRQALTEAFQNAADLILLDVMMPGLDGFEVTRRLRGDERTRLVPVVLITALRDTEDKIRGIEAGCDDFITKPFDKHEVLARVKALLKISYYRSLLDEKEQFEQAMEGVEDGIVVMDRLCRLIRVNRRAAALLGLEPAQLRAEVIGQMRRSFTVRYEGDFASDLAAKPIACDLLRVETAVARPLILALRSSVIHNLVGEVSSVVVTLRDVTDERKEQLLKQDFLGLISHKLRTPIAVIMSNAGLLQDRLVGPLNAQQQEMIDTIAQKSLGLDRLIENVLAFTTTASEACRLSTEPHLLQPHLPRLAEALTARHRPKPVELRLECPDPSAGTRINPHHLDLILSNLIDNAVKFGDKDPVQVSVTASPLERGLEIAITDNGPGIPPEEQEKIFERFYQVEKYFTGNVEGAGLGLPLVKHLVQGYGGTIRVRSQLGHGSTFTVLLPC